jgi:dimethylamine/trimethylamine dehydrogenase
LEAEFPADALVLVTARDPVDDLFRRLAETRDDWSVHGLRSVLRIGDCDAPATVAHAVHAGHLFARQVDEAVDYDALPFLVEPIL